MQRSETVERVKAQASAVVSLGPGPWTVVQHTDGWLVGWDGQVASVRKRTPRILRPIKLGRYLAVGAHGIDRRYVHQLVCEEWHGPRPDGMEVRHMDGDPTNNCAANLRWGTRSENATDKVRHGTDTSGERNPMAKLTHETVESMRRLRADLGWPYYKIAARFGVSTMTAYRAVVGQSWGGRDANQ